MLKAIGNLFVLLLVIFLVIGAVRLSPYLLPGVATEIDNILREDIAKEEQRILQQQALNDQLANQLPQLREQAIRTLQAQFGEGSFWSQVVPLIGLAVLAVAFLIGMALLTLGGLKKMFPPRQIPNASRQNVVFPSSEVFNANQSAQPGVTYHAPAPSRVNNMRRRG